jgi:hypothetical protein
MMLRVAPRTNIYSTLIGAQVPNVPNRKGRIFLHGIFTRVFRTFSGAPTPTDALEMGDGNGDGDACDDGFEVCMHCHASIRRGLN